MSERRYDKRISAQGNRMTSSNRRAETESASTGEQTAAPKNSQSSQSQTGEKQQKNDDPLLSSVALKELERGELSPDKLFEILKNERRRRVLRYLWDNDGKASLGTLAEHIAAIENDTTVASLSSAQRKRVYVALYQSHLPKMARNDVIDFDKDRGTVRTGKNARQTRPYFKDSSGTPWGMIALVTSVSGVGLLLVSQLGGAAYGFSAAVVAMLLIVVVAVLGLVQMQ